jgi:hypothetical protein
MGCYQSSGEKEIVHRRARSNMQKYILHNMYDSQRRPTVTELDIMTENDPLKLRTPIQKRTYAYIDSAQLRNASFNGP